jgi:hypothetical protein
MSADRSRTRRRPAPVVSRVDFPVLEEFLHAYLHEDFLVEYGSPEAARQVFLADASLDERHALAAECRRFNELIAGQPVGVVRRILAHDFGSAWWPARTRDVVGLLDPGVIAAEHQTGRSA